MARRAEAPADSTNLEGVSEDAVPSWLRVTAAWSWRLIVIGIVVLAAFSAFMRLSQIMLPLIIAMLICAPLERVVTRLERLKVPRGLGAAIALLGLIAVVLGLVALAGTEIANGFDELREQAMQGFDTFIDWLSTGPLQLDQAQIDGYVNTIMGKVQENWAGIASGAMSFTGTIGSVFAGIVVALLALYFFLRDGRSMWLWFVGVISGHREARAERIDNAGRNAWITLKRFTQTSAFVAFVDAVGIAIAAWILGIPLVFPIAIAVFLFSFIPLFGATISGAIAVLVALVDGGWVTALIMLGAVLLVQQIEGNVLYPWLFGKAVELHPIVILLAVSTGTLLLGLVGAVIAVPLVAFGVAFSAGLKKEFKVEEPPSITGQIPQLRDKAAAMLRRRGGQPARDATNA